MAQSLDDFTNAYTQLLVSSWSDEDFARRLREEPAVVAAEAGLLLGSDTEVVVVETGDGEAGDLATYYQEFTAGVSAGRVELVIPAAPRVDLRELTNEDLADVAGGGGCCCCCPCCCCNK